MCGELVIEDVILKNVGEVSSAPTMFWRDSEQGDQSHKRAVRNCYIKYGTFALCIDVLKWDKKIHKNESFSTTVARPSLICT